MHALARPLLVALALLAAAPLAPAAPAAADVYVPPPRVRLALRVQSVRALEVRAPSIDRDRALRELGDQARAFLPRLERCMQDHGVAASGERQGLVRARLRYERAEGPARAEVVESTLGAAARACVDEILPSLRLRPPPRGELTVELVFARHARVRL
jgi:hypothetical protein